MKVAHRSIYPIVKFPKLWIKLLNDPAHQIAALIIEKNLMRKGRRKWRDKNGITQKKGADLIMISDEEAAELGISPWLKRKALRTLSELELITLTHRPGKDSAIEIASV